MKTIYRKEAQLEILEEGTYKDVKYAILSLGTHPTAYIENIVNANNYNDKILDGVKVHCGFTYLDRAYWTHTGGTWLGWDYAHVGDYSSFYEEKGFERFKEHLKKWTFEEILEEVHKVIDQLLAIRGN